MKRRSKRRSSIAERELKSSVKLVKGYDVPRDMAGWWPPSWLPSWPWWGWTLAGLGVAGGIYGLLVAARSEVITVYGPQVQDATNAEAFRSSLPAAGKPYADLFLKAAAKYGLDPFVLAAIAEQESGFDPNARAGDDYGLMQINAPSSGGWPYSNDWADPETNITKGASILKAKIAYLSRTPVVPYVSLTGDAAMRRNVPEGDYPDPRPLIGTALNEAALAAYNTGELNVLRSLAVGLSPDFTTTRGNYALKVQQRIARIVGNFTTAGGVVV